MQTTVLVDAPARLDGVNSGEFGMLLTNLVTAGASRLILDLSALDYMSSAGVRSLLMAQKAVEARHGKLALLGCRPPVRDVLRLCGLEEIAPKFDSIEAARLAVKAP